MRTAGAVHGLPRVGPSMMQKGGRTASISVALTDEQRTADGLEIALAFREHEVGELVVSALSYAASATLRSSVFTRPWRC